MRYLPPLILCAAAAALMSVPAQSADEARSKGGVNASVEGGASLGGTGLDGTMADPRRTVERERQGQGIRIPLNRRDAAERGGEQGSASAGPSSPGAASSGGTDLGREADKEDEEFRKKLRQRK